MRDEAGDPSLECVKARKFILTSEAAKPTWGKRLCHEWWSSERNVKSLVFEAGDLCIAISTNVCVCVCACVCTCLIE